MANTKNRTYRVLAWALAIALTVLSLPIVPFSTWSSNLTNAIGDSMSINAHAYSFDNRPRVGAWWWHKEKADITTNYLNLLESAGITEVYYYAGWDFSDSAKNFKSKMSEIHAFVSEAMDHGIATSFLMDDLNYMSQMATNFVTYRNTYPDDWAYGFHFDVENEGKMIASFPDAEQYLVGNNIYVEYDFNPAWSTSTTTYHSSTLNANITGNLYQVYAQVFANGRGCMHLMAYRTQSAQKIFERAQERNNAVTICKNYNCDVVVGMECTEHESDGSVLESTVSLAVYGVDKNGVVDYIHGVHDLVAATGITSDFGVAIHHARSFSEDIDGNISADRTTSYTGGGVTESRTTGSYSQITTTTKNTSGMTLTKQALYYKGNMNVSVAKGGKYTDSAMTTAVVNDYSTNGEIDLSSGEYYEIILTGKNSANGDYLYPVMNGSGEYWASEYIGGSSISTSSSTVTAKYGLDGKYSSIKFPSMTLTLDHEISATFTVNSIEINVYRWTSGGGGTTQSSQPSESSQSSSNSSASSSTTQAVTPTGNNLLENGDFGITDTKNSKFGWNVGKCGSFSINNGVASVENGNEDKKAMYQNVAFEPGETYVLSGTISDASDPIKLYLSDASGATQVTTLSNGKFSYTFTADSSMSMVMFAGCKYTYKISDVQLHKAGSGEEESSEAVTYTVTVNNGTTDKAFAEAGDTVTITANAPTSGYQFKNWTGSGVTFANANNASTTFVMPASNVSVQANYEKVSYSVSVTLGTASKSSATSGETITLNADTPATGMEFDKWVVKSGSTPVSFANASSASTSFTMPAGNVSVEATYKAKSYTVTVNNGSASPSTQTYNNTVTITANTPQTGYKFKNWTTSDGVTFANANNATTTFTMPAKNVTVTANFEKINYTVSVTGGTASKTTANVGDSITLTPTVPSGKVFDKWTISPNTVTVSGNTFTMPASNVTVTASFKDAAYTVTVNNGSASPAGGAMGDKITISANTPATGYKFKNWTTSDGVTFANASSSTTTFTMPAKNVTVTANFEKINYTISVTGGTASKTTANVGDTITLTPTVPSGYAFNGWVSSDVTISNNTFTMPAKNVSISANFTEVIVEPDPPATPVLVSATVDGYNVIVKWNEVSGAAGYQVYRKSGGSFAEVGNVINGGSTTTFTDASLAKGTYTYTVKAFVNGTSGKIWGDYNTTGKSATVTFDTPTLVSAVASAAGITVTWQKVTDADGYRLYRKDGNNWVTVKTVDGADTTSYLAKGLVAGETYTYTLQAYYDSATTGTRQWTDYDRTGVSAVAQFGSPETEGQADGMKITINWAAVSGANGYRIYRKTADTSWHTLATVDAPTTTYTDENPVANVYYTYTVQAYTIENGETIYSSYDVTGTTKRVVLETPVLSDAEAIGDGVVVSWDAVTGATGYRLYRWDAEKNGWKTVKTVIGINTVSYTDHSAKAIAGAKYTVQAFRNANGVNVWSNHDEAGVTAQ